MKKRHENRRTGTETQLWLAPEAGRQLVLLDQLQASRVGSPRQVTVRGRPDASQAMADAKRGGRDMVACRMPRRRANPPAGVAARPASNDGSGRQAETGRSRCDSRRDGWRTCSEHEGRSSGRRSRAWGKSGIGIPTSGRSSTASARTRNSCVSAKRGLHRMMDLATTESMSPTTATPPPPC
jgi:hypothetical protein